MTPHSLGEGARPPLGARVLVALEAGESRLGTVVGRSSDTLLRPHCTVRLDGEQATILLLDDHLRLVAARPGLRLAASDGIVVVAPLRFPDR